MRKSVFVTAVILGLGCSACYGQNSLDLQSKKADSVTTKTTNKMKNLISIVEIPVTDFSRAVNFYQAILGVTIEEMEMDGVQMGILPGNNETVNVVLAKGVDYKPTTGGALLYLSAGNDLQPTLDKIASNRGKVIVPKTEISPEMGFFALFIDTEGNKLGLHSLH